MSEELRGRTALTIAAPREVVWAALVDPGAMTRYMPVTDVDSEWHAGAPIRWKAEIGAEVHEVEGRITRIEPERVLEYEYLDPITRVTRRVMAELASDGRATRITVHETLRSERDRPHIEGGWRLMLANLKMLLERGV